MTLTSIIPIEAWGKDHWSTLLHVESRAVDDSGKLRDEAMRTWKYGADKNYNTRLANGELAEDGHDDWCCLIDFMNEGLIEDDMQAGGYYGKHTSYVMVKLTDKGWNIAHQLRRYRGINGSYDGFVPEGI